MDYKELAAAAKEMGENKDCAVRALTAVSDTSYRKVHGLCEFLGRKRGKGTSYTVIWAVATALGLKVMETARFTAKTVTTLEKQLPKKGKFLISTRGHILAAVDGKIIDWTQGRRHRVLTVWEIN